MEEIKVRELPETEIVEPSDYMIIEDEDGTKKSLVKNFRSLLLVSLFFDSIQDLKDTPRNLKEGDVCMTLGYYKPGDGGAALYRITYNPAAVEDRMLVHYLSYSDTLRAEMILEGDSLNVHQFGAKGDGKTDDTISIQGAFDLCGSSKVIKFNKNQTYITRKDIVIKNDNTTVDGNDANIYPHYCNGFITQPKEGIETVYGIKFINLSFLLDKANSAISVDKAQNVSIEKCVFNNMSNIGINLKNNRDTVIFDCNFGGLNGDNSYAIVLDADNDFAPYTYRSTTVRDCTIRATRGIYLLSDVNAPEIITVDGMVFNGKSKEGTSRYAIYIADSFDSLFINNLSVKIADIAVYIGGAASEGQVVCNGLYTEDSDYQFEIGSNAVTVALNNVKAKTGKMFKLMSGKLLSNIDWDAMPVKATFDNVIGEIRDSIHPQAYLSMSGYSISGSILTVKEARNIHADWSSSTANLNEIVGGIKGQLLYIRSSTNKSVLNNVNKIHLSAPSIQLGQYKGIVLRCDGLKWDQIQ